MRPYLSFGFLGFIVFLAGCGKVTEADHKAALDCVKANLAAMQKGDVDAVLATIHPKSPAYLQTPELIKSIVNRYELSYELESAKVEHASSDGVRVGFVQVTRKLKGPDDFPDNRVEGLHLLKREGGKWKIWFTQVRQARSLSGDPLPKL
jgi:hypothetical protein